MKFPFKILKPVYNYLSMKKKKLEKQKKKLEKEDPFINTDRLIDNASSDTDAAEQEGHERVSALKKQIDKTLIRIRKTLTRIKLGKYGICLGCGKMIDTDRLTVDPTVEYCIDCQRKLKKSEKSKI